MCRGVEQCRNDCMQFTSLFDVGEEPVLANDRGLRNISTRFGEHACCLSNVHELQRIEEAQWVALDVCKTRDDTALCGFVDSFCKPLTLRDIFVEVRCNIHATLIQRRRTISNVRLLNECGRDHVLNLSE